MKPFVRLCGLLSFGIVLASVCGCGQQESKTIQQGDSAPAAPSGGGQVRSTTGTATAPKLAAPPAP